MAKSVAEAGFDGIPQGQFLGFGMADVGGVGIERLPLLRAFASDVVLRLTERLSVIIVHNYMDGICKAIEATQISSHHAPDHSLSHVYSNSLSSPSKPQRLHVKYKPAAAAC